MARRQQPSQDLGLSSKLNEHETSSLKHGYGITLWLGKNWQNCPLLPLLLGNIGSCEPEVIFFNVVKTFTLGQTYKCAVDKNETNSLFRD